MQAGTLALGGGAVRSRDGDGSGMWGIQQGRDAERNARWAVVGRADGWLRHHASHSGRMMKKQSLGLLMLCWPGNE